MKNSILSLLTFLCLFSCSDNKKIYCEKQFLNDIENAKLEDSRPLQDDELKKIIEENYNKLSKIGVSTIWNKTELQSGIDKMIENYECLTLSKSLNEIVYFNPDAKTPNSKNNATELEIRTKITPLESRIVKDTNCPPMLKDFEHTKPLQTKFINNYGGKSIYSKDDIFHMIKKFENLKVGKFKGKIAISGSRESREKWDTTNHHFLHRMDQPIGYGYNIEYRVYKVKNKRIYSGSLINYL